MGAAAEHRGNMLIGAQAWAQHNELQRRRDAILAVETAEACNAFTTLGLDYLVDPRGLRQKTVERSRSRRGWAKRHAALVTAHNAWVDTDHRDAWAYHRASVRRAQAAHNLLVFALGCWTIPTHIHVPRAVTP